jgi:hypothetical protein
MLREETYKWNCFTNTETSVWNVIFRTVFTWLDFKSVGQRLCSISILRSRVADYMAKSRAWFSNKRQIRCQRNPVTTVFCEDDTKLVFAESYTVLCR